MAPPYQIETIEPRGPTLPDVLDVLWSSQISEPGRPAETFRFSVLARHGWDEGKVREAIAHIANGVENGKSLMDRLRAKQKPHPPSAPCCDAVTLEPWTDL
jgi:hypothetical protein